MGGTLPGKKLMPQGPRQLHGKGEIARLYFLRILFLAVPRISGNSLT
jgi:hypothetical protein